MNLQHFMDEKINEIAFKHGIPLGDLIKEYDFDPHESAINVTVTARLAAPIEHIVVTFK